MEDVSSSRTRSITAVSAVSLWYKAGDFAKAEQLAYSMLADDRMADFARIELRNLVQAIWTDSSKRAANVSFLPGQVYVSVKGGEIVTGGAPMDLVIEKVQTIQSMFYRTIEFIKDMPLRKHGAPTADIQEACRPWLFQAAPGSYQFSVAIQEPAQRDFFREDLRPDLVASHFLNILKASVKDDQEELTKIVPQADYRNVFLKLSRNLAPTGKNFRDDRLSDFFGRIADLVNDRSSFFAESNTEERPHSRWIRFWPIRRTNHRDAACCRSREGLP